jgi:hypothetical protein
LNLQLHPTKPQAYMADAGSDSAVTTGYLSSTKGTAHKVVAGMSANSGTVVLLPTTFAPDGVLQVQLVSSSVTCESNGVTPAVSGAYSANVRYLSYTPATIKNGVFTPASYAYKTITVGTSSSVKLTEALLSTVQVGVALDGVTPLMLGDYIGSWSSRDSVAASGQTLKHSVQLDVAGLVSVETVPTRRNTDIADQTKQLDPTSTIGLQLGSISCTAEDIR